ncbi:MAG: endonuclease III, partial [Flavobacteriales bacterium]|nr:endonuclease III [Flavobacteriales bacterium]
MQLVFFLKMNEFHGVLPRDKELLVRLPGVGTKSANVIRAQGFGIPAMAVDTHVSRVAWRLGYTDVRDVV